MRCRENSVPLVLGIDPGSLFCGYGLVRADGGSMRYVSSGRIVLSARRPLSERLRELHEGLMSVMDEYEPSEAVVERVFFAKSAKAALSLGQARGIALLSSALRGLEVHEYSALEVKKAVTGYGRAEKVQVQEMVKGILGLRGPVSTDSADALALALCHLNRDWLAKASVRPARNARAV